MMRGLILLLSVFCVLPAQAAYISPALEVTDVKAAFMAPFEGEEEGEAGFVILGRDVLFGETARRVESCAAFVQAEAEGFTAITNNATPFYDDWLWVRCTALAELEGAGPFDETTPAPVTSQLVERLPPLMSERAACADKVAALKATLRNESWLTFEGTRQGAEMPAQWREQPPAQFDLIAASDKESTVLAVSPSTTDVLRLHLGDATGAVERLAALDRDGDGVDDLLVYLNWESHVFGAYRRVVLWLKGGEAPQPYQLLAPEKALGETMAQCPDHLSDVISGPSSLQK